MRVSGSSLRTWAERHRETIVDLVCLALAICVCAVAAIRVPLITPALVLGAELLLPRREGVGNPWKRLRQSLGVQAGVVLLAAAAHFFFLGWSASSFWLILIWIALAVVWRLGGILYGYEHVIRRWSLRVNQLRDRGWDAALVGALALGGAGWSFRGLNPALPSSPLWILALASVWLGLHLVPGRSWPAHGTVGARVVQYLWRAVAWGILGVAVSCLGFDGPFRTSVGAALGSVLLLTLAVAPRLVGLGSGDSLRWAGVLALSSWLMSPLAVPVPLGSGDSVWYGATLADVLTQVRAGVFPVFVGQSEYQFNGSVFPVRVAPLFHHLAILADWVTLRSLPFGAVQNLVLMAVGLAIAASSWFSLRRLLPEAPWFAAVLAMFFITCPGVLGILYTNDLYMSWTAVPLLPLAFLASIQTFRDPGRLAPVLLVATCAGFLWWAHSPIALWAMSLLGAIQVPRLLQQFRRRETWIGAAIAGSVFAAIVAFPIISVLVVTPDPSSSNISYAVADPTAIVSFLRQGFPQSLLPVSENGRKSLSDFQLGWSLWIVFAVILIDAVRRREVVQTSFAVAAVAVALLLIPVYGLTDLLWSVLPDIIRNTTGNWAVGRLYVMAAILVVFGYALTLGAGGGGVRLRAATTAPLLLVGVFWSSAEAAKFVHGTQENWAAAKRLPSALLPENLPLTRYSYLVFGVTPDYFSHGVVDPLLENRVLARESDTVIDGNGVALSLSRLPEGATLVSRGPLTGRRADDSSNLRYDPTFTLEPGRRYVLRLEFADPPPSGTLIVRSPSLHRIYGLPSYGGKYSFGAEPTSSRLLPLWTSAKQNEEAWLEFIPDGKSESSGNAGFASHQLVQYTAEALPVQITSWIPYRARLRLDAPGRLETPRLFQVGYRAAVNGSPVQVMKSAQGLATIEVPAGESDVVLEYKAPFALWGSYWLSLTGMAASAGLLVAAARPSRQAASRA